MRNWMRCIVGMAFSAALAETALGQEEDFVLAAQLMTLDDPIIVETKRGQDFSGQVESNLDGTLTLAADVGGGEVVYSFEETEILRVRFSGNELKEVALEYAEVGEYAPALMIIDKLFEQRRELFSLAGDSEVNYFAQTIPVYRAAERLREAYDRIEALRPHLEDADVVRLLEAEQLLLANRLEMVAETKALARTWIEMEGREVRSALGSCLLALALIDEGRLEEALQVVLFPITFSRARSIPYLDNCHSIALDLARILEEETTASGLSEDFDRRGYAETLQWDDFSPPDYSRLDLPRPPS